jgi:hypothetical protein
MKPTKKVMIWLCSMLTIMVLAGCGRVNKTNYDQIQIGMAMSDVEKILGSKGLATGQLDQKKGSNDGDSAFYLMVNVNSSGVDAVYEAKSDSGGDAYYWVDSSAHKAIVVDTQTNQVVKKYFLGDHKQPN